MKIIDLTIEHLEIPFTVSFSHASATRTMTDSVLVQAHTQQNTGYGESCPRAYVTQENYQSVISFFQNHKSSLLTTITSIATLKKWIDDRQNDIDCHPAAWCAIELAILDLLAKETDCTVENLLQLPELSGNFDYTAVLGDSKLESFTTLVGRYQAMGFVDFKIKLSGDIQHDQAKCDLVIKQVKNARIRLDANNLWHNPDEVIDYIHALNHSIFAIEEPLKANDYEGLSSISTVLGLKIILDESFLRLQQFDQIQNTANDWIINLRISKMGGILRSLSIIEQAKQCAIDCIVGAQVGETSILTRSALTIVNAYRDVVIAQEGGCGTYLLEYDVYEPVLMFAAGGRLSNSQIKRLGKRGFGLTLNQTK